MDIKCRRTVCKHNRAHTCCATCVGINKDAFCVTFDKREDSDADKLDLSKRLFESAPEYANSRHIRNVLLKCDATKCVFNKQKQCMANGITVVDETKKSCCATYLFKQ